MSNICKECEDPSWTGQAPIPAAELPLDGGGTMVVEELPEKGQKGMSYVLVDDVDNPTTSQGIFVYDNGWLLTAQPVSEAVQKVDELPQEGQPGILYYVPKSGDDTYDLYRWVDNSWIKVDVDVKLYGSTGQNTDGAMTQKAVTDAIGDLGTVEYVNLTITGTSGDAFLTSADKTVAEINALIAEDKKVLFKLDYTISGTPIREGVYEFPLTISEANGVYVGGAAAGWLGTKPAVYVYMQGGADTRAGSIEIEVCAEPSDIKLTTLSYGNSTWQDFIDAYNGEKVVYCRASSNTDPSVGAQSRLAFMAYVNNPTTPTEVEFQYLRSVSSKSASQQVDQVLVYKLTKTAGWTVQTRNVAANVAAGTNAERTYSNGTVTINPRLYTATGQNTDGGITQKLFTDTVGNIEAALNAINNGGNS